MNPNRRWYLKISAEGNSSFEVIANTEDLCGECPLWVDERQALYWTDIVKRNIYRIEAAGAPPTLVHQGFEVTGLLAHASGGFVVVNSQGLWHWDGGTCFKHAISAVDGHTCQLNDCVADRSGRVLSGSQFFNPETDYK